MTLQRPVAGRAAARQQQPAAARRVTLRRERVRRYRRRQRTGAAVLRVNIIDYHALVGVLIDAGWLLEAEALDRHQVEAAVSQALAEMAGWHRKRNA
jgi:hypothetical protein